MVAYLRYASHPSGSASGYVSASASVSALTSVKVGSLPPPHAAGCNRLRLIPPTAGGSLKTKNAGNRQPTLQSEEDGHLFARQLAIQEARKTGIISPVNLRFKERGRQAQRSPKERESQIQNTPLYYI
jgi:hypothetical protein